MITPIRRRHCHVLLFCGLIAGATALASGAGQAPNATLTGEVRDATEVALASAVVVLESPETALLRQATSNKDGAFAFVAVPPGRYHLRTTLQGFAPSTMTDITLNVGDRVTVRVVLNVAALGETTTVVGESQRISTSPAVGNVVDRRFVEDLPLNGRSLHALLEITPGVVLTAGGSGFSVNGQRTHANYITIDGVSANTRAPSGLSIGYGDQSASGQLPAFNALGGTNSLVSVDALQEFRINTSTYAPEFGRTPGGQVSLVTRSGTNAVHGSVSEYFRHDAMDASDWFANSLGLPKGKLRQHNFGSVFGGPIQRNRTFFFGSLETLRLEQPRVQMISVPTLTMRQSAAPVLRPYLEGLPLPNRRDLGGGVAEFAAAWTDRSRMNAASIRIDNAAGDRLRIFGRWNHAPSYAQFRDRLYLSSVREIQANNSDLTLGTTWTISARALHDARISYSRNRAPFTATPDDIGGATPPPLAVFEADATPSDTLFIFGTSNPAAGGWMWGTGTDIEQRQLNVTESLTIAQGSHEWKFGLDWRRTNPTLSRGRTGTQSIGVLLGDITIPRAFRYSATTWPDRRAVLFDAFSLYAQDAWRVLSRATLTYGLRWEFVPPPHETTGGSAITFEDLDDPGGGQLRLAPRGTSLWKTRYNNIAPRIGASYIVARGVSTQLVIRGGYGVFHDFGYGMVSNAYGAYPFVATKAVNAPSLPLSAEVAAPPSVDGPTAPTTLYVMGRDITLPWTHQWNVAAEQTFGGRQVLTVSYVGAAGRDLLKTEQYNVDLVEWAGNARTTVYMTRNNGHSDYRALQVHYQKRLNRGLQSSVSYTLGQSRDTASSDVVLTNQSGRIAADVNYGYSDYDVRHTVSAAVSYDVPLRAGVSLARRIVAGWGADVLLRARSGFPVQIQASVPFPPETETVRPDVVPGQVFWIEDASAPGGRRVNRAAFAQPASGTQGNLPRGAVRGFSARQVDVAVRREMRLPGQYRLQIRGEMFNIFNTPNFGDPVAHIGNTGDFGLSRTMLNGALGGLNSLYQMGGARSTQIAIKLLF